MEDVKLVGEIEDFPIKDAYGDIAKKINVIGNIELTSEEIAYFNSATTLLYAQLLKEKIDISTLHSVTILFLSDGNFSIKTLNKHVAGYTTSIIVYVMDKIRTWSNSDKIIAILLEELTHHFFNITDEIMVKHKVLEIMRNLCPELNMEDIYDNGQKYL